jgi:hypothetical protein
MHDKQNKKKSTQGGARRRLATTAPELATGHHCVGDALLRSCRSRQEGGAARATIRGGHRDAPSRRTAVEEERCRRGGRGGGRRRRRPTRRGREDEEVGRGGDEVTAPTAGEGDCTRSPACGENSVVDGGEIHRTLGGRRRRRRRWGAGDTRPRCQPPHTGSGFHTLAAREGKVGSRPSPVAEAAAPLARRGCRSAGH